MKLIDVIGNGQKNALCQHIFFSRYRYRRKFMFISIEYLKEKPDQVSDRVLTDCLYYSPIAAR